MNNVSKNMIKNLETDLGRLSSSDPTTDTLKLKNDLVDTIKSSPKENVNEKPSKKKKKEAIEATGAASGGPYSTGLFLQSKPEKSPEAAEIEVVKEELMGGEATEGTATGASTGQYSTPGWVAPNAKKWRGRAKTQIPGGKFVQIKKKCQTFPYCNQGDIKALKLYENDAVKNSIKNLSEKMGLHENVIKAIIQHELEERANKRNK
jgi:hypothetical protein